MRRSGTGSGGGYGSNKVVKKPVRTGAARHHIQKAAVAELEARVEARGWREPTPLGPPPGVAQADKLMDMQDARDRAELIAQEARRLAMQNKERR
jgi:hypothetical protein